MESLEYLHSKHIVHRDIKPENIVLDNEGYFRLTDFGFATEIGKETQSVDKEVCGTLEYISPEVLRDQRYFCASDIFSFGVVLYEIIFGYRPYFAKGKTELKEMIKQKKISVSPEQIPKMYEKNKEEIASFISGLLKYNFQDRFSLSDMKKHSWFKDFNWEKLKNKKIESPFQKILLKRFEILNAIKNENKEINNEIFNDELVGCETMERYKRLIENSEKFSNYFNNYDSIRDFSLCLTRKNEKCTKVVQNHKRIQSEICGSTKIRKDVQTSTNSSIRQFSYDKKKSLTLSQSNQIEKVQKHIDLLKYLPFTMGRNKLSLNTNSTYCQYKQRKDLYSLEKKGFKTLSKSSLSNVKENDNSKSEINLPKILSNQNSFSGKNIFDNQGVKTKKKVKIMKYPELFTVNLNQKLQNFNIKQGIINTIKLGSSKKETSNNRIGKSKKLIYSFRTPFKE